MAPPFIETNWSGPCENSLGTAPWFVDLVSYPSWNMVHFLFFAIAQALHSPYLSSSCRLKSHRRSTQIRSAPPPTLPIAVNPVDGRARLPIPEYCCLISGPAPRGGGRGGRRHGHPTPVHQHAMWIEFNDWRHLPQAVRSWLRECSSTLPLCMHHRSGDRHVSITRLRPFFC